MKHETCSVEIKVRMPASLRDRLEAAAAAERRTQSQLVRNLIEDALAVQAKQRLGAAV
jgi:predicted DNA-binding protein